MSTDRFDEYALDFDWSFLAVAIVNLIRAEHPCDICFHSKKPATNVTIKAADGMAPSLYVLSTGEPLDFDDIWSVYPMPREGVTEEQLASADMSIAEQRAGSYGETVRDMVRAMYHCESDEEEDYYLRRFIVT